MITIEDLRKNGADVEAGLSRCLKNEALYLKLVDMGLGDVKFEDLEALLQIKELDEAFEYCHALKGVIGNLGLTPLFDALCDMTEKLRGHEQADYMTMYSDMMKIRSKFREP